MADRLHLSTKHRRVLETLLREHLPDVEVWAYGSRVNGRSHDGSDLDLVLLGPGLKEIPTGQLSDFEEAVRESTIPFLVEARDWSRLPERFHREIERNYVVLVGGSDALYDRGISDVADEWRETKLGHVIELKRGYDLPQHKRSHGPVPVISSSGPIDYHLESKVKGPGVVTGRYGTLGQVFFIPDDFWPINTTLYVRDFKGNNPRFIHYFLQELNFTAYSDKAAVPGLNRNHLHEEIVCFPTDIDEQRTIAHILGTLDDKIELNRHMNKTLEAMARALFKSWFVDFDPVHAKATLRNHTANLPTPPVSVWSVERAREYLDRMDPAIADLFPDGFVESELGEIPEGWEVKPFSDFFDIVGGGTPKTSISEFWGGSIPWFSVTDTPLIGNVYVVETEKYITKAGLASSSARLVPKGTTIISARGTVGNLAIAGQEMAFNQSCYALRGINHVGEGYVYFSTQHMLTDLKSMAHGSVFSTITRKTFESVAWPMPSKQVLNRFEDVIAPLFSRLLIYVNGSRTLATLRDTLLPKLVSGEIRLDKENAINI